MVSLQCGKIKDVFLIIECQRRFFIFSLFFLKFRFPGHTSLHGFFSEITVPGLLEQVKW